MKRRVFARAARLTLYCLPLFVLLPADVPAQDQDLLTLPLTAKDPARPIEWIADRAWGAKEVQILPRPANVSKGMPLQSKSLPVGRFRHEVAKGPIHLVVDYAAVIRNPDEAGTGSVWIGIECPEGHNACAQRADLLVMPFKTTYMARQSLRRDGRDLALALGRETHAYLFPEGTVVEITLNVIESEQFEPQALKARLFYGDFERNAFPGQLTKLGMLGKIIAAGLLAFALLFWWIRR